MAIEMKGEKKAQKRRALRPVGIREAARLTGCSVAHVWYIRHGERKSARFAAKMRELGIKFKEGK